MRQLRHFIKTDKYSKDMQRASEPWDKGDNDLYNKLIRERKKLLNMDSSEEIRDGYNEGRIKEIDIALDSLIARRRRG